MTLEERRIIKAGIRNDSTKVAIARTLGKNKSTIGKEIKLHRYLSYKCALPRECASYRKCRHSRECSSYRTRTKTQHHLYFWNR
ncbi:MAG: helix-turn-helix domain-containing protein [Lachnospiraceae bacterium]